MLSTIPTSRAVASQPGLIASSRSSNFNVPQVGALLVAALIVIIVGLAVSQGWFRTLGQATTATEAKPYGELRKDNAPLEQAELNLEMADLDKPSSVAVSKEMPETRIVIASPSLPSFDCAKASFRDEQIICANSELARWDREMSNAYRLAAAKYPPTSDTGLVLRRSQREFVKDRRRCLDDGCIATMFDNRIRYLESFIR